MTKYYDNFTKIYFSTRWLVRAVIQNRDTRVTASATCMQRVTFNMSECFTTGKSFPTVLNTMVFDSGRSIIETGPTGTPTGK